MKIHTKKIMRMVYFVEELKLQRYPNAESFSALLITKDELLAVSSKTVTREIKHLKEYYKAPIYYDPSEKGFYLADLSWQFPYLEMEGEELFASLMAMKLSNDRMPTPLLPSLHNAEAIQLAASSPDNHSPEVLNSLILATTRMPPVSEAIFINTLSGWRNSQRLSIKYKTINDTEPKERFVDFHALFLSGGAWYAYAFCHTRNAYRNFALHRITDAKLTLEYFERDLEALKSVKEGFAFSYNTAQNVKIECSPKIANIISEREWFKNQVNNINSDGKLEVTFSEVPENEIVSWVLSYGGGLKIKSPKSLRIKLIERLNRLKELHQ